MKRRRICVYGSQQAEKSKFLEDVDNRKSCHLEPQIEKEKLLKYVMERGADDSHWRELIESTMWKKRFWFYLLAKDHLNPSRTRSHFHRRSALGKWGRAHHVLWDIFTQQYKITPGFATAFLSIQTWKLLAKHSRAEPWYFTGHHKMMTLMTSHTTACDDDGKWHWQFLLFCGAVHASQLPWTISPLTSDCPDNTLK